MPHYADFPGRSGMYSRSRFGMADDDTPTVLIPVRPGSIRVSQHIQRQRHVPAVPSPHQSPDSGRPVPPPMPSRRVSQGGEHPDTPSGESVRQGIRRIPTGFLRGVAFLDADEDAERDLSSFGRMIPHIARNMHRQRETIGSVADVAEHHGIVIGVASTRGLLHQISDEPTVRQDAVAYAADGSGRYVIAALADGVSAAEASSIGSALAVDTAIGEVQGQLGGGTDMNGLDWEAVNERIHVAMRQCCASYGLDESQLDRRTMAHMMGTTCEVVVVDTAASESGAVPIVRAVLAGDGAGYILRRPGSGKAEVEPLGSWELKDGVYSTSAVEPLPLEQPGLRERICKTMLNPGECVIVVTDGIGKDMGNGRGAVSQYIHDRLMSCDTVTNPSTPEGLLGAIRYAAPGSADDRSMIALWR